MAIGGIKRVHLSARRSHLRCIKIAMINPALANMNSKISDHLKYPCTSKKSTRYENVLRTNNNSHIFKYVLIG